VVQIFVKDWNTLAGLRAILGLAEGLFFPYVVAGARGLYFIPHRSACILLISSWYPRHETAKRITAFYLGGLFFGGGICQIFAYLFGTLNTPTLAGWQWIFVRPVHSHVRDSALKLPQLLFGVITVACSFIGIFIAIPHFPTSDRGNKHLSHAELELVRARIEIDRACTPFIRHIATYAREGHDLVVEKLTMRDVVHQLMSFRGWLASLLFCLSNVPTYALCVCISLPPPYD
jgi:hypothetical protein